MKIVTLTKRIGRTINLGDMNFIKIEAEATATFDSDTETTEDVDKVLFEEVSKSIQADKKRIAAAKKAVKDAK